MSHNKSRLQESAWQGGPGRARIRAARNFGEWAADQMGWDDLARLHYVEALAGHSDPVQKVRRDLRAQGFAPGADKLQLLYADCLRLAAIECGVS